MEGIFFSLSSHRTPQTRASPLCHIFPPSYKVPSFHREGRLLDVVERRALNLPRKEEEERSICSRPHFIKLRGEDRRGMDMEEEEEEEEEGPNFRSHQGWREKEEEGPRRRVHSTQTKKVQYMRHGICHFFLKKNQACQYCKKGQECPLHICTIWFFLKKNKFVLAFFLPFPFLSGVWETLFSCTWSSPSHLFPSFSLFPLEKNVGRELLPLFSLPPSFLSSHKRAKEGGGGGDLGKNSHPFPHSCL